MTAIAEDALVEVLGDRVLINQMDFGGAVVELIDACEAGDRTRLFREIVELGSIILRSGQTQALATVLETASERLERTLAAGTEALPEELKKGTDDLLEQLQKLLTVFDPKVVDSIPNQIAGSVKDAGADLVRTTILSLLDEGGPLAVVLEGLTKQLETLSKADLDVIERVTALAERVDGAAQLDDALERGPAKGLKFEDYVLPYIELIHQPFGDEVEHVGKQHGEDGCQGDVVVTINARETRGRDLRIVIEAKTGRLTSPKAGEELEAALSNRGAAAAILVFDDVEDAQSVLAGRRYGQRSANTFVVVLDPEDGNALALEVALQQARAVALASLDEKCELDGAWLTEQCDRLAGVIDAASAIKNGANAARRGLDKVDASYGQLRSEALAVLEEIKERLAAD
jgi:hypothetical protein